MNRIILHIDMDAFFAQIEERENPQFKGKLVVVGADPKGGKGRGTPAKLNTGGAIFRVLAEKREVPEDEWQKLLEKDKIPPDPFEIKIGKEATVFEGKYFIAFSTIDKQTGIDYYEVKEGKRVWEKAESPHLLEDQSLRSKISVKAVDKAGNERISEYFPPKKPFPYWIIVLILVGIGVIWVILKRIRKR